MANNEETGLLKDKKMSFGVVLKRTYQYIKPEIWSFVIAFILIIINVGLDIITPLFTKWITDGLQAKGDAMITIGPLLGLAFGYLAICIVNQVFRYFESMILTKAGQKIVYNIRMDVFKHIENMSQNQLNDMAVGSLVTRVANYTSSMADFYTSTVVNIIRYILTAVGVFVIMVVLSPLLSVILLGFVVVIFVVSLFFSKYVHKLFGEERNALSDLNTFLNEALSGMKIIQIFNHEKKSMETFDEKNEKIRSLKYRVFRAFGLYRPFISLLYVLSIALILYLGVIWGLGGGTIVAFYLYLSRFFNPIQSLADELNHIQRAITNSERLFNLMDIVPEVLDKPGAREIDKFKGKIEFKNVWFAYEEENWILKDVSFVIEPKQTAAFVGATGAGKTTILGLIVRNFEIQKGQILIDDIDIQDIKMSSLRKAIGQMLQDVFLFSGTIRDNITLFDESYTDEQIMAACDYVNLSPMIKNLSKGLDEEVIERGENYSTGQRQLLSFARTVLSDPQIMILDEATANIDTETELVIQDSLEKIKNIGTMLVVAHRLSTIQHADKIIVLSHGEIVEQGNHQELLKNKKLYYKLYKLQFEEKDQFKKTEG